MLPKLIILLECGQGIEDICQKEIELKRKGFINAQRFSWRRTAEELLAQYKKMA